MRKAKQGKPVRIAKERLIKDYPWAREPYELIYYPRGSGVWFDGSGYSAGCRHFKTKREALRHWRQRAKDFPGRWEQNGQRARQFVRALEKFERPR